jgi:hypothetical protein
MALAKKMMCQISIQEMAVTLKSFLDFI